LPTANSQLELKPSIPKGTRDFSPTEMVRRNFIFDTIKNVYQKFGFQQIETPAMENLSTLEGKYGEEGDQLLFKILNSGDYLKDADSSILQNRDSRQLVSTISEKGLRYDLTVPFARYVVMNRHEITFPFKRYQIQPVWRADRPQKGRYREFYQCDADVVGTDSLICEAEIILMINEIFLVLGITDYSIKINHRAILSGLAEVTGSKAQESSLFVAIDKLDKVGEEKVKEELLTRGVDNKNISQLFEILNFEGNTTQKFEILTRQFATSDRGQNGITELREVLRLLNAFGEADRRVEFDISLARGLSYYSGTIFEVKINNVSIGSVSGIDRSHVKRVRALIDMVDPVLVSGHLAWSTHAGDYLNDLLPLPYDEEALRLQVQGKDLVVLRQTMADSVTPVTVTSPSGATRELTLGASEPGTWRTTVPANE